jgi:hypothetical protein
MPAAVFSGQTAGWLHGLDLPWKPIEVTVPDVHLSARADVVIHRSRLAANEVVGIRGLRSTTPLRTAIDLGRRLRPTEAVVALDMALHVGLATIGELRAFVALHPGSKGIGRLRRAVELADPASESPMETRFRILIFKAGLPRPETQVELRDSADRFLARTDFYYRDQRLAIEYDGGSHRHTLEEDNRRQNRLLEAGYRLLRFTAADVRDNPDLLVAQIAAALGVSARKRALNRPKRADYARKRDVSGAASGLLPRPRSGSR